MGRIAGQAIADLQRVDERALKLEAAQLGGKEDVPVRDVREAEALLKRGFEILDNAVSAILGENLSLDTRECAKHHVDVLLTETVGGLAEIRGEECGGVGVPCLDPGEDASDLVFKLMLQFVNVRVDHGLIDFEAAGCRVEA